MLKLTVTLRDSCGVEVETFTATADDAALRVAQFILVHGTSPGISGWVDAAGSVEFAPAP